MAPSSGALSRRHGWAAAFWAASRLVATWLSCVVVGKTSQADNMCAQAEACHNVLRAIYQDAPCLGKLRPSRSRALRTGNLA